MTDFHSAGILPALKIAFGTAALQASLSPYFVILSSPWYWGRWWCNLTRMDLMDHFRMLARYNRIANERLYARCAELDDDEYRGRRQGSFGSIHALLNHILLGDRIWMERFRGSGRVTPALNTILFEDFSALRSARVEEDTVIESFFNRVDAGFLVKSFLYSNNQGRDCVEAAPVAVSHFFNHQTHHRGQVHVMLSHTRISPPSLDLHRIINP